jgi:transcriptional regulator with XRE-family HTH domain
MATKKWSEIRATKVPDEAVAEATGLALRDAIALSELRHRRQVTQVELARRLEIGQSSLSAIENRPDVYLSTLREYVEALGGSLELAAMFDGERVPLTLGRARVAQPAAARSIRR